MTEKIPAADLKPGDVIEVEIHRVLTLTVKAVEPTGSVKFGSVGPDATPIVRVHFEDMPAPFKGTMDVAGDQAYAKAGVQA